MAKLLIDTLSDRINFKKVAKAVYKTLNQKAPLKAEVVFVSKEEIQRLNKETRNVDAVTDVLSYPSLDGICERVINKKEHVFELDGKRVFIGSIVLCEDRIKEQANEIGHSEEDEIEYLVVHGLMHLFGYDHMIEDDKALMRKREKQALKLLGKGE